MTKIDLHVLKPEQKKALLNDIYKHRKRQCCGCRELWFGFVYLKSKDSSLNVVAGYVQECPICEKVYTRVFDPVDGVKMVDIDFDPDKVAKGGQNGKENGNSEAGKTS